MTKNNIVVSAIGLKKRVCTHDCSKETCARAHPNSSGSTVRHPQWCCQGWVESCTKPGCPFNHFRNEAAFVYYRMSRPGWAEKNQDLIVKYAPHEDIGADDARPETAGKETAKSTEDTESTETATRTDRMTVIDASKLPDGVHTYAEICHRGV